jgi:hypothetical protein
MHKDGLFVQWLHISEIDLNLVVSVLKAVSDNFTDYEIFMVTDSDMIIVACKNGQVPKPEFSILNEPAVAASLARLDIKGEQDFTSRQIGRKKNFAKLLNAFAIRGNSDYFPVLDQQAAKTRFLGISAQEFAAFVSMPLPLGELLGWIPRRTNQTYVTPSPFLSNSRATFEAMMLRDFFRSGRNDPIMLPDNLRELAQQLILDSKGMTNRTEDERLVSQFNVAIAMIPHLSPIELESLWSIMDSGATAYHASPRERMWHNLFKAAGRRDAIGMRIHAQKLLLGERNIAIQARKFLLATAMVGALANGDRTEASRFWLENNSQLFAGKEPDLLFRLLNAESRIN